MPRPSTKKSYMTPHTPSPTTVRVEGPGFFSNVMAGFGLGTGQAIAHNLFRSDPPPQTVKHVHEVPKEYIQCLKEHEGNDTKECEKWLGM